MLLLSFWILFVCCVASNAYSGSSESVGQQQNHDYRDNPGFSSGYSRQGYGQQPSTPPHGSHTPPVYGWYQPPSSVRPDTQGYGHPTPQANYNYRPPFGEHSTSGGYGQKLPPIQIAPNVYQEQRPQAGYGFPSAGGYSPNVPFPSQAPPNFPSHGFQPGYGSTDQQRSLGYHPNAINHHHGPQSPFPYGGHQQASGYNPSPFNFGPQQPHYPNGPNPYGQQPPSSSPHSPQAHGGQQPWFNPNITNQPPSTGNFGPQDQNSFNGPRGLQLATGGFGPNALHPSADTSGLHSSKLTIAGLQTATGGYGPDAINPPFDGDEYRSTFY